MDAEYFKGWASPLAAAWNIALDRFFSVALIARLSSLAICCIGGTAWA